MGKYAPIGIVADESNFHRGGVATMLQIQFNFKNVIQVTDEGSLKKELAKQPHPDLLAVDVGVLGTNGTEALQAWRRRGSKTRVVVFTPSTSRKEMLALFAAGAHGVIPTDTTGPELIRALEIVQSGGTYVPYTLRPDEHRHGSGSGSQQMLNELTDRQKEVLFLLSQGYPNKVIARKLGISPSTVKVHVHALFRAFGVHTRMGAAAVLSAVSGRNPFKFAEKESQI